MPGLIQLPGPQDIQRERERAPVRVPALKDYALEREEQRVYQKFLLEQLRYRYQVKHHLLTPWMQPIRAWSLRNAWWILLLAYEGYALTAHSW